MAGRPKSQKGTGAAQAGLFVLAALAALPVLASPVLDTRCSGPAQPTLDIDDSELIARPVSSTEEALEGHLLEQQIESAARSAFAEDEPQTAEDSDEASAETPPVDAAGPTLSDREPSPYKRQMYRRDI